MRKIETLRLHIYGLNVPTYAFRTMHEVTCDTVHVSHAGCVPHSRQKRRRTDPSRELVNEILQRLEELTEANIGKFISRRGQQLVLAQRLSSFLIRGIGTA